MSARFNWELYLRPIDYALRGLAPLASNIGHVVARARAVTRGKDTARLYETYPVAILEALYGYSRRVALGTGSEGPMADDDNEDDEGAAHTESKQKSYKGGRVTLSEAGAVATDKTKASHCQLESLANEVGLRCEAGSIARLTDDEFDGIICALVGHAEPYRPTSLEIKQMIGARLVNRVRSSPRSKVKVSSVRPSTSRERARRAIEGLFEARRPDDDDVKCLLALEQEDARPLAHEVAAVCSALDGYEAPENFRLAGRRPSFARLVVREEIAQDARKRPATPPIAM